MDDGGVLGFARTCRHHHAPACRPSHIHGLHGFGDGANLVGLEQHRVAGFVVDGLGHQAGLGDQIIVAHHLNSLAYRVSERLHSSGIAFGERVFHRHNRVFIHPAQQDLQPSLAVVFVFFQS